MVSTQASRSQRTLPRIETEYSLYEHFKDLNMYGPKDKGR